MKYALGACAISGKKKKKKEKHRESVDSVGRVMRGHYTVSLVSSKAGKGRLV